MSDNISIVGLGAAGVNIATCFAKFDNLYKIYTIDIEGKSSKYHRRVFTRLSAEEYEKHPINLKTFFKGISDEVIFIVCGAGDIAGLSLTILEQIRKKTISIVYVKPDLALLSKKKTAQERVSRYVLQNYARSGVFHELILIENALLEQDMGATIKDPYSGVNDAVSSAIHSLNYFRKNKPILGNEEPFLKGDRLRTLGFVNADMSEEKLFFELDNANETRYYLSIGKEKSEDPNFLKELKDKLGQDDGSLTYFSIYPSVDESDFGIILKASAEIQD